MTTSIMPRNTCCTSFPGVPVGLVTYLFIFNSQSRHAAWSAWYDPAGTRIALFTFIIITLSAFYAASGLLAPRFLFRPVQVILLIPEKSRKSDPVRILFGSIYSGR